MNMVGVEAPVPGRISAPWQPILQQRTPVYTASIPNRPALVMQYANPAASQVAPIQHSHSSKPTTWQCQHCHHTEDLKLLQKAWRENYESSFLFLWLIRLARKGGRNLVGDAMDGLLPFPKSWKEKIHVSLKPAVKYYSNRCWDYEEIAKRLIKRKRINLFSDFFMKTVVNTRIDGTLRRFYEGQVFLGSARLILLGITCQDVGKYAYRAYKYPEEREKNLKLCLRQAVKWTIGTEIGNIGSDLGFYLCPNPRYKILSGFLMDALWSATFDKLLQKYISIAD